MLPARNIPQNKNFFCREPAFYRSFWSMMAVIALQNVLTYSVNVADNLMLGMYDQMALAGAATVNQLQYVLQMFTLSGLGEGLIIIAGQYWGRKDAKAVQSLTGTALCCGLAAAGALTAAAFLAPDALAGLFTDDLQVRAQAVEYLSILRYTYIPFVITSLLLSSLRSVQVVSIAFRVSCMTLVVNVGINSLLIFGLLGFPEMGVRGAAVGTFIARLLELAVVAGYCLKKKLPLRLYPAGLLPRRELSAAYIRVTVPCLISALLFGIATSMQTVVFGHLSADALTAASVSGTLFQYCKMVPSSAASAAGVWIANAVGRRAFDQLRGYVHSLQLSFFGIGLVMGGVLLLLRWLVLPLYTLTPQAREYASQMLLVMAVVAVGMSYQMPCQLGIIRSGGDTRYSMVSDLIYSWLVVVPLGLLAAFVWKLPVAAVCLCLNCDQLLKCITVSWKTNRYTWVRELQSAPSAAAEEEKI